MNRFLGFICFLPSALLMLFSCKEKSSPNIINDLGWKDVGFMGSNYYETPNLDTLAGQGNVSYNAYAVANCAPSRACMMSSMNTPKLGAYTVDNSERGNAKTRKIIPTPNRDFLGMLNN